MDRRQFLTLPLAMVLAPLGPLRALAGPEARRATYAVDVGILYGLLSFHLDGAITEAVDRAGGRYEVKMAGEGDGIANRIESSGVRRDGRWQPLRARSSFVVMGRESRSDIAYDWAHRTVDYHFRGETFFLRRVRVADDVVPIPEGLHVDDSASATLNYADGVWQPQPDGILRTHVVRRQRNENEGPDDVQKHYRAEVVPFTLRVTPEPATGRTLAQFDLTRFSSWAKPGEPAQIMFGRDRRPESMALSMILGTSVKIQMKLA